MNKFLSQQFNGGEPLALNDARWILGGTTTGENQYSGGGIYDAFIGILENFGDNFIVQGCETGGTTGAITLTEGWVYLDNQLLKVDAQTAFDESVNSTFMIDSSAFETDGLKTFQNGDSNNTYNKVRAIISGTTGNLAYNGDGLNDVILTKIFPVLTGSTNILSEENNFSLKRKVVEIGDWNMNGSGTGSYTKDVAHGITDHTTIRSIDIQIREDVGNNDYVYPFFYAGGNRLEATNVYLTGYGHGGHFDDAAYSDTSYNRGWITIWYV